MKYLKMLGLAAVAAMALMAFGAGSASAGGVLCSTTVSPCPTTQKWPVGTILNFTLKAGTSASLVNAAKPSESLDTCTGSGTNVKGKLTANPDAAGEATGENTEIKWEKCTFPTTTLKAGKLRVNQIAGTSNGTVYSDAEIQVTINTIFFGSCIYGVKSGVDLGTITEGNPAQFDAKEVPAEILEPINPACPPKSLWSAEYTLTAPSGTTLSVSSS